MFIVIAAVGIVLLLVTLMLDDVLDDLFGFDWLSGPVIGGGLAAFGVFGWMTTQADDANTWLGIVVGAVGGVALGYATYRLTKGLVNAPTDATPGTRHLVGATGRVITAVPEAGLGEVIVRLGGQPVKLSARSPRGALARGTEVVVIDAETATRVVVEPADAFWELGDSSRSDDNPPGRGHPEGDDL